MAMKDRNIESNDSISLDFILALNRFRSDFMAEQSFQVFGIAEHRMQDRDAPNASGRLLSLNNKGKEAGRFCEVAGVSIVAGAACGWRFWL